MAKYYNIKEKIDGDRGTGMFISFSYHEVWEEFHWAEERE